MIDLPKDFLDRMREVLMDEYDSFIKSYEKSPYKGVRINSLKNNKVLDVYNLKSIPWCKNGYYYLDNLPLGKLIYHDMGLYYIQEPSAMSVVEELDIKSDDKVLDLCAAPGGKSTQIAAYLNGTGLLVSNEIVPQRAKILSSNIERMGIKNCVVTNESPQNLTKFFNSYFDKILVDAPCSGEGMFKKAPIAIDEWSKENVNMCAIRQKEILNCAKKMLNKSGRIVFSTCTFSYEENEGVIQEFLDENKDFYLVTSKNKFENGIYGKFGLVNKDLLKAQRIYPHKVDGEGHFFAILQQEEKKLDKNKFAPYVNKNFKVPKEYFDFEKNTLNIHIEPNVKFGDNYYLSPIAPYNGLKIERCGLHLGQLKKNRFEPSHSLALALNIKDFKNVINLEKDDKRVLKFINGESIETNIKGWGVVCVDSFPLGWFKGDGYIAKNHYPKGLRKEINEF